ncbi:MAG: nucleotidyltransferase domain-containing protein [Oscillospiraceae bacterium]|nr:nucleotidyltransferase domain-containing protein [Oscillospiraceae bacterium]
MLDKKTVMKTVEQYAEAVTKELSPSAIFLFGSYINGHPHEDSDIDIGIVFDGFTGDWMQTETWLWRLRRGISFDIEPHLLDSADDKSGFAKHVIKTGQMIYQAGNSHLHS